MKPQPNQKVWVHYTGKFSDGTVFNTTENNVPLTFTVGTGEAIKGFDAAVMDMEPGEKRTVVIPVEDAYGERNENLVLEFPLSEFPDGETPRVGMEVVMADNAGNTFPCIVVEVREDSVMLDANHPLSGHELTYDIHLLSIEKEHDDILNPSHTSQFSNEENIKLIGVLREMSKDIDSVTDIDFNDALKVLVK